MCSGGKNDNGTRRGRGIVWKWTDGRIVKEDPVRGGMHSMAPWISCATDTFDEGPSITSLCIRGESSLESSTVDVEGRSQGGRDRGMGDTDSLELGKVRRRPPGGVPVGLGPGDVYANEVWKVPAG